MEFRIRQGSAKTLPSFLFVTAGNPNHRPNARNDSSGKLAGPMTRDNLLGEFCVEPLRGDSESV
jgi:hypothetical protein